ncbi:MAG: GNAT family N-acetyltransferase [Paracoccaceae bacterium]
MRAHQTLATERLCLRGLCAGDRAFVCRLIADPLVRQFLGGAVADERRADVFNSYCETGEGEAVWLVEIRGSGLPIGMIFLSHHKDGVDMELSYQFDRDFWGQGYASEALRRVLRHAADDLGLRQVIAETQSANVASCRLLERLGMVEQRRVRRFGAEQIIYVS